jgi:hypothetical protein
MMILLCRGGTFPRPHIPWGRGSLGGNTRQSRRVKIKEKQMKNITELNKHLTDLYEALQNGTVDVKTAAEMNNTAGKIINVQKVQLEYAELRGVSPSIQFLDGGNGK